MGAGYFIGGLGAGIGAGVRLGQMYQGITEAEAEAEDKKAEREERAQQRDARRRLVGELSTLDTERNIAVDPVARGGPEWAQMDQPGQTKPALESGGPVSQEEKLLRMKDAQARTFMANPATVQQGMAAASEAIQLKDQLFQREFSNAYRSYSLSGNPQGIADVFKKYHSETGMAFDVEPTGAGIDQKFKVTFNYGGRKQTVEWSKGEFDKQAMMLANPQLRGKLAEMQLAHYYKLREPQKVGQGERVYAGGELIAQGEPKPEKAGDRYLTLKRKDEEGREWEELVDTRAGGPGIAAAAPGGGIGLADSGSAMPGGSPFGASGFNRRDLATDKEVVDFVSKVEGFATPNLLGGPPQLTEKGVQASVLGTKLRQFHRAEDGGGKLGPHEAGEIAMKGEFSPQNPAIVQVGEKYMAVPAVRYQGKVYLAGDPARGMDVTEKVKAREKTKAAGPQNVSTQPGAGPQPTATQASAGIAAAVSAPRSADLRKALREAYPRFAVDSPRGKELRETLEDITAMEDAGETIPPSVRRRILDRMNEIIAAQEREYDEAQAGALVTRGIKAVEERTERATAARRQEAEQRLKRFGFGQ